MRKILISLMGIALVGSVITAGIYGSFRDTETGTGNEFTAGTLNLVPSTGGTGPAGKYTITAGGDGVNGNVVFQKLAPGDSEPITWTLTNNGDLDGTLTAPSTVTFIENGSNEPESAVSGNNGGSNGDLDEYMGVRLKVGDCQRCKGSWCRRALRYR